MTKSLHTHTHTRTHTHTHTHTHRLSICYAEDTCNDYHLLCSKRILAVYHNINSKSVFLLIEKYYNIPATEKFNIVSLLDLSGQSFPLVVSDGHYLHHHKQP